MNEWDISDEEVAEQVRKLGLSLKPEDIGTLAVGVRRNREMAANNRLVVNDDTVPVLFIQPARRPAKGS